MLNEKTIATIKATAPVLAEHGETLTRHFYERMFVHNPEVAPYFNPAHQTAGKQQRALAGAIVAYANNIENLEVLSGAVELIAQKHASLLIKPEHYPIVGGNLLASIREVLGDAATDDILNAWAEAYGLLANILMKREAEIYSDNAKKPGGWEGFKTFRVVRKEKESNNITSFYLAPANGAPLAPFKAGQYITVRLPTLNGQTTMRNYSLSDSPNQDWYRISVKREQGMTAGTPEGYVSNLLHNSVEVGAEIEIAPPCGEFFFDADKDDGAQPLVLLAGGVGITPIMSIFKAALEVRPERKIILIHACLNEGVQPFQSTFDALTKVYKNVTVHYRYSDPATSGSQRTGNASTGFVDAAYLDSVLPDQDARFYFCGPQPFMVNVYGILTAREIPEDNLQFEFFGPREALEAA
ncbi:MAG: NO-inducible flavohemoprotein [Rhodobacteraceae bacterium]|nr:NO-inducible flavohemoprotein [Paracoccaceae bacterium]